MEGPVAKTKTSERLFFLQRDLALRGAAQHKQVRPTSGPGGNVSALWGVAEASTARAERLAAAIVTYADRPIARGIRIERIRAPPATLENTSLAKRAKTGLGIVPNSQKAEQPD